MTPRGDEGFPANVYAATVLAPLFEATKLHYAAHFRAIDRAHLVMAQECGVIAAGHATVIARGLDALDRELDPSKLQYTGEFEDFFFLREAALRDRVGADIAGRLHIGRSRNDIDHTVFKLRNL